MYKKDFNYDGYDEYLYTGLHGLIMNHNHKIISKNIPQKLNKRILEIGGAAKPHCSVVKLKGVDEYWISDLTRVFRKSKISMDHKINKHIYEDDRDYKYFTEPHKTFTRIIVSHVWEHLNDPEGFLLKWINLLDDEGCIDIAIPCDPGWAWRFGQLVSRKKACKIYGITAREIDLIMTREHINSCQNLIRIVKCYTNKSGHFFPFKVPITDINLFVFFRLNKFDFN